MAKVLLLTEPKEGCKHITYCAYMNYLIVLFISGGKGREGKGRRLTVCWLNCDIRPIVQYPVSHVEIVFNFRPQITCLNVFSKSLHKQRNTTKKINTSETVECLKHSGKCNFYIHNSFPFPLNSLRWENCIAFLNVNQI